jgi:hypothetical protein
MKPEVKDKKTNLQHVLHYLRDGSDTFLRFWPVKSKREYKTLLQTSIKINAFPFCNNYCCDAGALKPEINFAQTSDSWRLGLVKYLWTFV